jgi:hypothetical protein
VNYQLQAAKAAQLNAKLAMDSEIGGVNTNVAQIQAQLSDAKWQLDQTTVRAPSNGTVTTMALAVGDRALQARAVMSFIIDDEITIVGMFSPNGFRTINPVRRSSSCSTTIRAVSTTHGSPRFRAASARARLRFPEPWHVSDRSEVQGPIRGSFPCQQTWIGNNYVSACPEPRRSSQKMQASSDSSCRSWSGSAPTRHICSAAPQLHNAVPAARLLPELESPKADIV